MLFRSYKSPGGEALGFYSSLRLRCMSPLKLKQKHTIHGKEHERTIGIKVTIEVFKSSVWKPFRTAEVFILYDYGIDDIRGNLTFLKSASASSTYVVGDKNLGRSLDAAIEVVEKEGLEKEVKAQTISLWNEIEQSFVGERKPRIW